MIVPRVIKFPLADLQIIERTWADTRRIHGLTFSEWVTDSLLVTCEETDNLMRLPGSKSNDAEE
jgi:hypothetical protein